MHDPTAAVAGSKAHIGHSCVHEERSACFVHLHHARPRKHACGIVHFTDLDMMSTYRIQIFTAGGLFTVKNVNVMTIKSNSVLT